MSDEQLIFTETDGHVGIIRLNRPKVYNAPTIQLFHDSYHNDLLQQLASKADVHDCRRHRRPPGGCSRVHRKTQAGVHRKMNIRHLRFSCVVIISIFATIMLVGCAGGARPLIQKTLISRDATPVVSGFGGKHQDTISVDDAQWNVLHDLFKPPRDTPADERQRIRAAIALMERIAGEQTLTGNDVGKNRRHPDGGQQMDCLDETANTTTYLLLFQQEGWLHYHEVMERAFRAPLFFDSNFAALVREIATGQRYVVDSWFLDNGRPPYVQEMSLWLDKEPFDEEMNPPMDEFLDQIMRNISISSVYFFDAVSL